MPDQEFTNDHDILITLVAEVRQARTEIKELKDNSAKRLDDMETLVGKAFARIERLEGFKNTIIAMSTLTGVITGFLAVLLINHLIGK